MWLGVRQLPLDVTFVVHMTPGVHVYQSNPIGGALILGVVKKSPRWAVLTEGNDSDRSLGKNAWLGCVLLSRCLVERSSLRRSGRVKWPALPRQSRRPITRPGLVTAVLRREGGRSGGLGGLTRGNRSHL